MDFKSLAWDPEPNKHQAVLVLQELRSLLSDESLQGKDSGHSHYKYSIDPPKQHWVSLLHPGGVCQAQLRGRFTEAATVPHLVISTSQKNVFVQFFKTSLEAWLPR